jgi:hypothetical protein
MANDAPSFAETGFFERLDAHPVRRSARHDAMPPDQGVEHAGFSLRALAPQSCFMDAG